MEESERKRKIRKCYETGFDDEGRAMSHRIQPLQKLKRQETLSLEPPEEQLAQT